VSRRGHRGSIGAGPRIRMSKGYPKGVLVEDKSLRADAPPSDETLASLASRAYQLAQQHGEDPWIAVARMMRAWLAPAGSASAAGPAHTNRRRHRMGDMADDLTERGVGAWLAHLDGDCPMGCTYCEQEERATRQPRQPPRLVSPPQEPSQP